MFYLLALLTLLAAIRRNSSLLAFLSGVLLGTSILTKETAVVNVPLALLAVLLLDWQLRQALWHYLGVVLVCLPWWVWAYSATRDEPERPAKLSLQGRCSEVTNLTLDGLLAVVDTVEDLLLA